MSNRFRQFFLVLMISLSVQAEEGKQEVDNALKTKLATGLLESNGAKSIDFYGVVWGALDAKKSCRPLSGNSSMPASMDDWLKAVGTFSDADKARDRKFRDSIFDLKVRLEQIAGKTNKALVLEAVRLQLDSVNINIEAIDGNNGRMALRKKLLEDLKKSLEKVKSEDKKMTEAYNEILINQGLNKANAVAQDACARVQNVEECTTSNGKKTCSSKANAAPVPGCDTAIEGLKNIHDQVMNAYWDAYLGVMPSQSLDNKMEELENKMALMNAKIPKSNDAAFDWTAPMVTSIPKLRGVRRSTGLACNVPNDAMLKSSAVTYIWAQEIFGDIVEKSSNSFVSRWKEDEKRIGQSANRIQYFEGIQKLLEDLEADDSSQLALLKENKKKIEPYYETLKKEFEVAKKDLTPEDCGENPYPSYEKIVVCGTGSDPRYCDRNNPIGRARLEYVECISQAKGNESYRKGLSEASSYVKNHPDFVDIVPGVDGIGWKAKMRSPDGKIYFLDSTYDPKVKPRDPCQPDKSGAVFGGCTTK